MTPHTDRMSEGEGESSVVSDRIRSASGADHLMQNLDRSSGRLHLGHDIHFYKCDNKSVYSFIRSGDRLIPVCTVNLFSFC